MSPFQALTKREVGFECVFHYVQAAVEFAGFFLFGDHCAYACRREKGGNASSPSANTFRKRSLRHQVEFNFALQNHLFQQFIFANVGSNVLPNLSGCEQQADAKAIHAGVVAHGG